MGVLETDEMKHDTMKADIIKEYFRRTRKILKTKLNASKSISVINARAVSLIRYSVLVY